MHRTKALLRFFTAWVVCVALNVAAPADTVVVTGRGVAAGGGVTYLIKQGFEGTGYDNSESWSTAAGDPDPDSASNAFEGTQSLDIDASSDAAISPVFTAQSECWVYFTMYVTAIPTTTRTLLRFQDAANTATAAYVDMTNTGAVRMLHSGGGTANSTPFTASINTRYHVWVRFKKGTGANGEIELWHSTTDTKPGSSTDITTNGVGTIDAERVIMGNNGASGAAVQFDKIRVDDVVIGSAPE